MELNWRNSDRREAWAKEAEPQWEWIGGWAEDRIWCTMQSRPDICAEVINRADEVIIPHQQIRHSHSKHDREDPCSNETLNGLLWRQLNKLGTTECNSTEVGENVVTDYQRDGQEEPNHAFEDVVHYEVGLHDDEIQGHVCPGELGELEAVVTGLEGGDKEDEA